MQRSSLIWIASALAALGAIGCADEGVGDPCVPEAIPCNSMGQKCGYKNNEAYIEASSVQCKSRLCLVYKLDNGTNGGIASDPRVRCDADDPVDGCVDEDQLGKSVYCTIRCEKSSECPSGYSCEPVLNLGGPGIRGSYCVNEAAIENPM